MRGAAMSLKAAVSGLVIFLLSVSVVKGEDTWRVTHSSAQICAVKGSTVEIPCTYTYPSTIRQQTTVVQSRFWFTKDRYEPVDVRTDPDYSGRVEYLFHENVCTLRIKNLRERDSAVYKFMFTTNQSGGSLTGDEGVTLSITDLQVQVERKRNQAELKCYSSCNVADNPSYVWYRNGKKMTAETSSIRVSVHENNKYSCSVKGREDSRSPEVYAPKLPSVSVSPSAEIVEGSSVTLTCSSDANPAPEYTWYNMNGHELSKESELVFSSVQSSDSGRYYCKAKNDLGERTSGYVKVEVKYAPKLPSVSVSPSAEIVEGSSVTLTCSSDANPAATFKWYKRNQTSKYLGEGAQLVFSSIKSSDSGEFSCKAENDLGKPTYKWISIDVKYAPKLPSVSVSPSAEIVEGSSVTLNCSSDANPAANYTWYKENGPLNLNPSNAGAQLVFSSVNSSASGEYYCEAENTLGRRTSKHISINVKWGGKSVAVAGTITVVLLVIVFLSVLVWIRQKRASNEPSEAEERQEHTEQGQPEEQEDLQYASIHFSKTQEPLYSNTRPARPPRRTEQQDVTEYTAVKFTRNSTAMRTRSKEPEEDPAALYSTVNKSR